MCDGIAARHAIDQAYAELVRIDALMSEWKPNSPISQVNAAAGESPVVVPAELRAMLERSKAYGGKSAGTFDITWHGMAQIWHFDDRFVVPSQAAIDAARRNVDTPRVIWTFEARSRIRSGPGLMRKSTWCDHILGCTKSNCAAVGPGCGDS